jgi:hypothetical protein
MNETIFHIQRLRYRPVWMGFLPFPDDQNIQGIAPSEPSFHGELDGRL